MSFGTIMFQAGSDVTTTIGETASDFSIVSLLLDAHIVVQLVLVVLIIASLWSWAVILEKWFALGNARKAAEKFEDAFWSGRVDDMEGRPGGDASNAAARVFSAASREWNEVKHLRDASLISSVINRAEKAMKANVDREVSRASNGLGVLASVGSASPFIGLFGTVWGIMYAFINIAASQDTSLGVVAGPIAEALFATGLGLIAAIPATIFYNKFTLDIAALGEQLDAFVQDVVVRMSRRATDSARD